MMTEMNGMRAMMFALPNKDTAIIGMNNTNCQLHAHAL